MSGPGGRDQILGGIRRALGRGPLAGADAAEAQSRLAEARPNLVPARTRGLDGDARLAMFAQFAEEADATTVRVPDRNSVPKAIAEYLAARNLPAEAVMAPDAALDAYPWADQPLLTIRRDRARESDAVGITTAFCAIAETGTIMLASSPDAPTTLNFLPGTHIVVIEKSRVVGSYEEAWARLRERNAGEGGAMPRAVNFVTGPSRTGDIEQRLQLGAHGPIRLHLVLVEGP